MDKLNIYIDSDVIVASELKEEANHAESKKFMDKILSKEYKNVVAHTSIFTFVELASAMIRRTNSVDRTYSLLYKIRNVWKRKQTIFTLTPIAGKSRVSFTSLVDDLIDVAVEFRMTAGDVIHAKTVAEHEIGYLVTWNKKHFVGLAGAIEGLNVMTPIEMMDEITKLKPG